MFGLLFRGTGCVIKSIMIGITLVSQIVEYTEINEHLEKLLKI